MTGVYQGSGYRCGFIWSNNWSPTYFPFVSGFHRRPADAGRAEHSHGWRTRAGDPTDCAVHLRSEWDFQGLGWNGGGTGIWVGPDGLTHTMNWT